MPCLKPEANVNHARRDLNLSRRDDERNSSLCFRQHCPQWRIGEWAGGSICPPRILVTSSPWSSRLSSKSSLNMYLLPCTQCDQSLKVSPAQAGDSVSCPACKATVSIPRLGDLRRLEVADPEQDSLGRDQGNERSSSFVALFAVLGLIAAASLLASGFCGIRWAIIEVPATTDEHISIIRDELSKRTAAELIREYEDMESRGLDLGLPFQYKEIELTKANWGQNAIITGSVGLVALLVAVGVAGTTRRKNA